MPNWIEGTMKLRGRREDIKRFLDNELEPSVDTLNPAWSNQVIDESDKLGLHYIFRNEPHVKDTRRMFITSKDFYFDDEYGTACLNIKQAWSFSPREGDVDISILKEKADKYHLDIRMFGIEGGIQFTQEVIILCGSDVVTNNVWRYTDWEWECPFPYMGG